MIETNKVYKMDAFELLKQLPDKSVDLVLIDPPYNIGKDEWDKIENYNSFLDFLFLEIKRVLKTNGSVYCFSDNETCNIVQNNMDKYLKFLNHLIWIKEKYSVVTRNHFNFNKFVPITERIFFYEQKNNNSELYFIINDFENFKEIRDYFEKERNKIKNLNYSKINKEILGVTSNGGGGLAYNILTPYTKNWQFPSKKSYMKLRELGIFKREWEELNKLYKEEFIFLKGKYKKNTRTFNNKKGQFEIFKYPIIKKPIHPMQKPLELIKDIISHSSNKGDVVLDCFVGSGTTAVACKQLGRNFICCDNNAEYVAIANKRLAQQSVADFTSATPTFVSQKEFNKCYQENSNEFSQIADATSDTANIKLNKIFG